MGPIKQRQYSDTAPRRLSLQILRALDFFDLLMAETPRKEVWLRQAAVTPLIIASDAQADPGTSPSGGAIVIDPISGHRQAVCFIFSPELLACWSYDRASSGGRESHRLVRSGGSPHHFLVASR